MADETLRLVASVKDDFTTVLGKLDAALKRTGASGAEAGKNIRKDFEGLHGTFSRTATAVQGITQGFQALGTVSLGAGLGIGGIATALRDFGKQSQGLAVLSQQTGLAKDTIRGFEELAKNFGVSVETSRGAMQNFSDGMRSFQQRYSESYAALKNMNLGQLAEDIIAAPNRDEAFKRALSGVQQIKDADVQRRVSTMLFGTPDISGVMGQLKQNIVTEMGQIEKEIEKISPETEKQAIEFEKNLNRMGRAFNKLKFDMMGEAATNLNGAIDAFSQGRYKDALSQLDRGKNWDGSKGSDRAAQIEAELADKQGRFNDNDKSRGRDTPAFVARQKELAVEISRLTEELKQLREKGATVQQQSFGGGGFGGGALIHKAGFGGMGGGGMGGVGSIPPLGAEIGGNPNVTGGGAGRGYGAGAPGGTLSGGVLSDGGVMGKTGGSVPRGPGTSREARGNAKMAEMMRYAQDQLIREGVPPDKARQAAAHLVGQAYAESHLNPNAVHDGNTGFGIYGARDPKPGRGRKTDMLRWLAENNYAPNSAEGQMREMAHRAMSGRYRRTKSILMGGGSGNLDVDTNTITGEFESPAVINARAYAVRNAYRAGGEAGVTLSEQSVTGDDVPWHKRPRSNVPGQMSRLRDDEVYLPGSSGRAGDAMIRRRFGDDMRGGISRTPSDYKNGKLDITLNGFPGGTRARASMDDIFKEVNVSKKRQIEMAP